jgi:hypothetical protein
LLTTPVTSATTSNTPNILSVQFGSPEASD